MSIDEQTLDQIAGLAKLEIDASQKQKLSADLANILSLVDQLQQADTSDVEAMAHPTDATQQLREDTITEAREEAEKRANRDKFQSIAPATEDGLYLVPKVID